MSELTGEMGELKMKIQVTRAATGKVEDYELTSQVSKEQFDELTNQPTQVQDNGRNT